MKKFKILIIAIITLMSIGCAQVSKEFNKQFSEKFKSNKSKDSIYSKYQPKLNSNKAVDSYFELMKSVNKQIVNDTQGIYYHKTTDLGVYRTYFNNQDSEALRNLFSTSIGLMAPVYQYVEHNGPKLIIDWKATERRHNIFSKKLKLNILPLSTTKKYQKVFEQEALTIGNNFNYTTLPSIIKKSHINADYIIRGGLEEDYFINYRIKRANLGTADKKTYDYSYRRMIIMSGSLYFTPIQLLNQMTEGTHRNVSGCNFINTEQYKEEADKSNHRFREFYRSLPKSKGTSVAHLEKVHKDHKEAELKKSLSIFIGQLPLQKSNQIRSENICVEGFSKMKISGALKSNKLN